MPDPGKWAFKDKRTAETLVKVAAERRSEVKYLTAVELAEAGLPGGGSVIIHLDKDLPAATFNPATKLFTLGEALGYVYRRDNLHDTFCSQTHDVTPEKKSLMPDRDELGDCNIKRVYNPTLTAYEACSFVECVVDNHGDLYVSGPSFETTLTTTTSGIVSPPGPRDCMGRCKFVWSYDNQEWTEMENECSTTTTTTTVDPTTTTSTTTTAACFCGDPSFTPTTTTLEPRIIECDCAQPQFCGIMDGDCTWTNCVDVNISQPGPVEDCTTSTSTSTTTTSETTTTDEPTTTTTETTTTCPCTTSSTTSTTPAGCSGGCDWFSPNGREWKLIVDNCLGICPCPPPPEDSLEICGQPHTDCAIATSTTTSTQDPRCSGHCDWFYGPFGAPDTFDWWLTHENCSDVLLPVGVCACPPPSEDGTLCGTARTYCGSATTTTETTTTTDTTTTPDPCCTSSTTSTTPNPCDTEVCIWRWSEMEDDWIQEQSNCGNDCSCYPPSRDGAEDCELQETSCNTGTTTSSTTTTPCGAPGQCIPECCDVSICPGVCCFDGGGFIDCIEGVFKPFCDAIFGTWYGCVAGNCDQIDCLTGVTSTTTTTTT